MKNHEFSFKKYDVFYSSHEYISSKNSHRYLKSKFDVRYYIFMKNSIYIPACRFFLVKKYAKNHEKLRFFIKKYDVFSLLSRVSFVKNRKIIIARISGDGRSHFHEKFDLHTGVSILSDEKILIK